MVVGILSFEQIGVDNRIHDQSWKCSSENWVFRADLPRKTKFQRRQISLTGVRRLVAEQLGRRSIKDYEILNSIRVATCPAELFWEGNMASHENSSTTCQTETKMSTDEETPLLLA
jgi:hypothetical protein